MFSTAAVDEMFLFTLQERYLLAKIRASRSFEADDSRPRTQHRRLAIWRTDKAVKLLSGRMSETDKRAARMGEQRRGKKRSVSMASGLPAMMYGFGDDPTPNSETVELMEVLVKEHLRDVLGASSRVAEWRGSKEVDSFCVMWTVKKDPRRYAKMDKLLKMNDEIKVSTSSMHAYERAPWPPEVCLPSAGRISPPHGTSRVFCTLSGRINCVLIHPLASPFLSSYSNAWLRR